MKLPFRLAKVPTPPGPAEAAALFTDDPAVLARVGAKLPTFPTVFRLPGGFLLLAASSAPWPPGVVRLRRLGGDLFVPLDAQLLPRLLPDEMIGLTRDTGLVVLVNAALRFDPVRPLRPADWLRPGRLRREAWAPLPTPSERAERLTTIERPSPPGIALEILTAGQPDGTDPLPEPGEAGGVPEDARPPTGSFLDRLRSGAAFRTGQFLTWLGGQFQMPGLGKLGGNLARKAVQRVPRLTEKVLGAQEAALRELLRQLQSGDVEKALKRAPIAVGDPEKTRGVATGANLTPRDPRFSLASLLGGGGEVSAWLGGGDVWPLLAAEYRRLAEEAVGRGDVRRAAYLYGVLLRDLRAAANALMAGGYFREAGVLFRDKLADTLQAAAAFARAGDYDEAARLYEKRGEYETAAELFRRIGDEDRATVYFERAVERLKGHGQWLAAGNLLRAKLGRRQAATDCYRQGWRNRGPDSQACGERCVDDFLVAEAWDEFDSMLDEAAATFGPPHGKEASAFFNYALHVGEDFLPAARRADVRDRVRLLFARHLRADGTARQAGEKARGLFLPNGGWTSPQLRDAEYAARALAKRANAPAPATLPLHAGRGTVTAVASARQTGDLLLAIDGEIFLWNNATSDRTLVAAVPGARVLAVATSPDAGVVYALSAVADGVEVRCFTRATDLYRLRRAGYVVQGVWRSPGGPETARGWTLLPQVDFQDGESVILLTRPSERIELRGHFLQAKTTTVEPPYLKGSTLYLFERTAGEGYWEWDEVFCRRVAGGETTRWVTNVVPGAPDSSPLHAPSVGWLTTGAVLFAVCVLEAGTAVWQAFEIDETGRPRVTTAHSDSSPPIAAAFLQTANRVAAVTTANEVLWLTPSGSRLVPRARPTSLGGPGRVVFLAPGATGHEALAVCANGQVVRVFAP